MERISGYDVGASFIVAVEPTLELCHTREFTNMKNDSLPLVGSNPDEVHMGWYSGEANNNGEEDHDANA